VLATLHLRARNRLERPFVSCWIVGAPFLSWRRKEKGIPLASLLRERPKAERVVQRGVIFPQCRDVHRHYPNNYINHAWAQKATDDRPWCGRLGCGRLFGNPNTRVPAPARGCFERSVLISPCNSLGSDKFLLLDTQFVLNPCQATRILVDCVHGLGCLSNQAEMIDNPSYSELIFGCTMSYLRFSRVYLSNCGMGGKIARPGRRFSDAGPHTLARRSKH
jgi:hypothetical protein